MQHTDEYLLDLYFTGEAKAFEIFFARHSGRVVAYGKQRGLNHQDALDFTQDVFLRLHRVIHQYERGRPALPWFFTIVHHMLIDTLRQITLNQTRYVHDEIKMQSAQAMPLEVIENGAISPEALARLSEDQKKVVELRLLHDFSFKDIAVRVGKTEATTRKIYERSMKVLKSYLLNEDNRDE